jgi:hypothetical protein
LRDFLPFHPKLRCAMISLRVTGKNFQRKSVEGLSVLLFVAAFLGNLFYVLSVLSSPLVQEEEGETGTPYTALGAAD